EGVRNGKGNLKKDSPVQSSQSLNREVGMIANSKRKKECWHLPALFPLAPRQGGAYASLFNRFCMQKKGYANWFASIWNSEINRFLFSWTCAMQRFSVRFLAYALKVVATNKASPRRETEPAPKLGLLREQPARSVLEDLEDSLLEDSLLQDSVAHTP